MGISRTKITKIIKNKGINIKEGRYFLTKHIKSEFLGNIDEEAYLLGFVNGDLYVNPKNSHTLRLSSGTTHRDFFKLIKICFDLYGPIYCYPTKQNDEYKWNISIELDLKSFSFLLDTKKSNLQWPKYSFIYFLAGSIDSDGSIIIRKVRDNFQYIVRIFNQNVELLKRIKEELIDSGYHPIIYVNARKGKIKKSKHSIMISNKDDYILELCRKDEVIKLIKKLPIKHPEKIKWKSLIFEIEQQGFKKYKEIENRLNDLRNKISSEVENFIEESKIKYNKKLTFKNGEGA